MISFLPGNEDLLPWAMGTGLCQYCQPPKSMSAWVYMCSPIHATLASTPLQLPKSQFPHFRRGHALYLGRCYQCTRIFCQ